MSPEVAAMEGNKLMKSNRIRLNQNPYVSPETKLEIDRRIQSTGKSIGRIIDEAISASTTSTSTQKAKKSCQSAKS